MNREEIIVAIIVTFHPERDLLEALLAHLAPQITHGLIVNNDSALPFSEDELIQFGFGVTHLGSNRGIAEAFNIGIQQAIALNATKVILFDQDSTPDKNMVEAMLSAFSELNAKGIRVGAVGPVQVDRKTNERTPFVVPSEKWGNYQTPTAGEMIEVDHLISSGCMIPVSVLQELGPMLSELFIDGVDFEWSWRCRAGGYRLFAIGDACMMHSIGHDSIRIGRRRLHLHSPTRQYYIFRNLLYLKKRMPHAPTPWKRQCMKALLLRFAFFCVFTETRMKYLKYIARGVLDGWRGTLGPMR